MKKIMKSVNDKGNIYAGVYVTLSLLCLLTLSMCVCFSHGDVLSSFFFHSEADTGMDFFHSIEYVNGRSPYDTFNTLYPPLANLFFYVIFHCVPISVSQNWPLDYQESILMRQTSLDLRVYQAPMVLFLLFVMLCIVLLMVVMSNYLERNNVRWKTGILFAVIFSYGVMYSVERGNIILLTVTLTMVFVFNYNSDKKVVREISYICLALAAGLKIYPAFFGLLLIKNKKWGAAVRTIIYGIASVVLPMCFFNEGVRGLGKWLNVMINFTKESDTPWIGNGFSNILYHIKSALGQNVGYIPEKYFGVITILIVTLLMVAALLIKKEWKSVLVLTIAMCLFQSQADYVYSFFCIPMLCLLAENSAEKTWNDILPYVCMMLMILPLPLFYKKDEVYPRNTLVHIVYLIMIIWTIYSAINDLREQNTVKGKQA